jgi:hypothetical protein
MIKKYLWAALILLFLLHTDVWFWNDARLVAGIPVGLAYHALFCIAASLLMWALVRHAWPPDLEGENPRDRV